VDDASAKMNAQNKYRGTVLNTLFELPLEARLGALPPFSGDRSRARILGDR
jgi:hypothetical protein